MPPTSILTMYSLRQFDRRTMRMALRDGLDAALSNVLYGVHAFQIGRNLPSRRRPRFLLPPSDIAPTADTLCVKLSRLPPSLHSSTPLRDTAPIGRIRHLVGDIQQYIQVIFATREKVDCGFIGLIESEP